MEKQPNGKKTFRSPTLTVYGGVAELTQGPPAPGGGDGGGGGGDGGGTHFS